MYFVYYLRSERDQNQHYAGYTENIETRLIQHNSGIVASTKPYMPWELIFYEAYKSRKDAKRREMYFKTTKGKKTLKLMLQDFLLK